MQCKASSARAPHKDTRPLECNLPGLLVVASQWFWSPATPGSRERGGADTAIELSLVPNFGTFPATRLPPRAGPLLELRHTTPRLAKLCAAASGRLAESFAAPYALNQAKRGSSYHPDPRVVVTNIRPTRGHRRGLWPGSADARRFALQGRNIAPVCKAAVAAGRDLRCWKATKTAARCVPRTRLSQLG